MYRMHKKLKVIAVVTIMAAFAVCAVSVQAQAALVGRPKYVFFFLGDGMANSQVQAAEAYLTTLNGGRQNWQRTCSSPQTGSP